ncbi:MAG: hypothetical protein ACOX1P_12390 [Thermoguttaceae bacterium]|jgi:hypothetical protein
MSFLLDTNICSAHLKRPGGLAHRMMQHTGKTPLGFEWGAGRLPRVRCATLGCVVATPLA